MSPLRFRYTSRQFAVSFGITAVVASLARLAGARLATVLVGLAVIGVVYATLGLDVDREGLVIRSGVVFNRRIAWANVASIVVERSGATGKLVVVDGAGKRRTPPAPATSTLLPDPDFDAKAQTVLNAWAATRPRPPAAPEW